MVVAPTVARESSATPKALPGLIYFLIQIICFATVAGIVVVAVAG